MSARVRRALVARLVSSILVGGLVVPSALAAPGAAAPGSDPALNVAASVDLDPNTVAAGGSDAARVRTWLLQPDGRHPTGARPKTAPPSTGGSGVAASGGAGVAAVDSGIGILHGQPQLPYYGGTGGMVGARGLYTAGDRIVAVRTCRPGQPRRSGTPRPSSRCRATSTTSAPRSAPPSTRAAGSLRCRATRPTARPAT
jgi:hypothetical protein